VDGEFVVAGGDPPEILQATEGRLDAPAVPIAHLVMPDRARLSGQVSEQVFAATGLRITAHQFRHAAAAILQRHRPGEYELVRRLLGHQSITTTTRFYTGLEALQATRLFGEIVGQELQQTLGTGAKGKKTSKAGQKAALAGSGNRA
jgi:hypothetical protein